MNPGNKEERIAYMVTLLKRVGDEGASSETKIKGATVERLCEYPGGGYFRVIRWLEKQASELKQENSTEENLTPYYKKCRDLMMSRNKKYGDSWRVLTIQSVANLIEMKMNRIANMKNEDLDPKIEDEFIDTVNYAIMGLYKYNHDKN